MQWEKKKNSIPIVPNQKTKHNDKHHFSARDWRYNWMIIHISMKYYYMAKLRAETIIN